MFCLLHTYCSSGEESQIMSINAKHCQKGKSLQNLGRINDAIHFPKVVWPKITDPLKGPFQV